MGEHSKVTTAEVKQQQLVFLCVGVIVGYEVRGAILHSENVIQSFLRLKVQQKYHFCLGVIKLCLFGKASGLRVWMTPDDIRE